MALVWEDGVTQGAASLHHLTGHGRAVVLADRSSQGFVTRVTKVGPLVF